MFKSKSFDLINEDELKKRDNMYDPKRCRWMRFIVIPAFIGFILLLILANVDFTGTAYLTTTSLVTDATTFQTFTPTLTTTLEFVSEKKQHSAQIYMDSDVNDMTELNGRASASCIPEVNNVCKMSCSGTVSKIKKSLEDQQKLCPDEPLEVTLRSYKSLSLDFLKGNFQLLSLTITDSQLSHIWPDDFNQNSVSHTLKTLILEDMQFDNLERSKFAGLQVVTYFRLENYEPDSLQFLGLQFLAALAATLTETNIVQYTTKGTKYKPNAWLNGANFEKLIRVDLSNNYFPDTLDSQTFSQLTKLQVLILSNCSILSMQGDIFNMVMKTLQYLDLRNNQLTTLSGDFLSYSGNNLKIEMSANKWDCTCDNNKLIEFIKNSQIESNEEPKCSSPEEWHDFQLKDLSLQCDNIISTTDSTTAKITELPDSSTSPGNRDPSSETTITSTEPQDISTITNTEIDTTTEIPETNPVNITCKDYTNYSVFNQTIQNYDSLFGVYSESSTSVLLIVLNDMSKIRLIYFIPKKSFSSHTETDTNASTKVTSQSCERVVTTTLVHIQGLVKNETYVFCLVPHDETKISPFNCRSHQLENPMEFRQAWLYINDIAWTVPVIAIGIIVCIIFGSSLIYWILRWRPTWLCGSKRLINMGCKPHEMLLLPKADCTSVEDQYLSFLSNMQPTAVNSYDYMQYYKHFETSNLKKIEYLPENLPPSVRAPEIPSCSNRPASTQSTIAADDLMQHMDDLENDYQSLDHYERII